MKEKTMKEKLSAAGSVVAAILASACCIGPVVLAALGVGSVGFASTLEPYRPYFAGVTFVLLGTAWYFALRRSSNVAALSAEDSGAAPSACRAPEACCAPANGWRRNILLLTAVTAFALLMLAFPWISGALAGAAKPAPKALASAHDTRTATLRIEGMT
ncbi:MAG: hypothetical protein HY320_10985 [Armatimonadetes bacterium]|nr:hypothetical protein [Armatimonadota bacterium]